MARMTWSTELDTGIDVIDKQHRRIVDYINLLHDARTSGHSREDVSKVIDELIDYTLSHFAFEESMQEDSNYPFFKAHKKVHELFTKRVGDFRTRFAMGEDVAEELNHLLVTWLFNHIKRDDADYVGAVKANLSQHDAFVAKKRGFFGRLFGG
ncbi:MAG: bacteriohemerythrin [Gallionella sp.]|nr:bacteriohemerythrin [Gallionella sp.]